MGYLSALAMADGGLDIDAQLGWHLQSNHYPPVNPVFIPVAKQAIEAAVYAETVEDWSGLDEMVEMPNGLEKSLGEIIDGLHLHAFIFAALTAADDEDEEGNSWD